MKMTVKDLLNLISRHEMKMDDYIDFEISDETREQGENVFTLDMVDSGSYNIDGVKEKTLTLIFDLNTLSDEE